MRKRKRAADGEESPTKKNATPKKTAALMRKPEAKSEAEDEV
jgi:hypothetical protein